MPPPQHHDERAGPISTRPRWIFKPRPDPAGSVGIGGACHRAGAIRTLRDPQAPVPGTTMGCAGAKDARDRADLLAWLKAASRAPVACRVQR